MNEMFLLKMGEIVLKGLNRASFEGKLHSNLSRRLKPYGKFKIRLLQSTYTVDWKTRTAIWTGPGRPAAGCSASFPGAGAGAVRRI